MSGQSAPLTLKEVGFNLTRLVSRLVVMEFLNNEDVKQLYVFSKSPSQMVASRSCASDNTHEKGIYFLKTTGASKLTADQMSKASTAAT